MSERMTHDDMTDSLTGHEEMAIATHFGSTLADLSADRTMFTRALVFVDKKRAGQNEDDAREASLAMRLKDVLTYFPEESAATVEESGKDEQPGEPELPSPEISLSSVS